MLDWTMTIRFHVMSRHTEVVLALVISSLLGACGRADDRAAAPRHLIFISLDTVRRDHLPTYGYPRDTAPSIDELAAGGIVFDNALAQDTNTNPSHTSMFTGVYPHVHGNRTNGIRLAPNQVTLASILQGAGFRTAGFVTSITMTRRTTGLERGFDIYEDDFVTTRRDGRIATDLAVDWLRALKPDDRGFLFLHLYDAHGPYEPRAPYDAMFRSGEPGPLVARMPEYQEIFDEHGQPVRELNRFVDLYDGLIRYVDDCVASVLAEIDLRESIVVVVADHGETLGERYWQLDHGGQLFDEQIRIPLILRVPDLPPQRVAWTADTVDLLPTLLDLLAVDLPSDRPVLGRNLTPYLRGEAVPEREWSFASARAVEKRHADRRYKLDTFRRIHSVRTSRWKMIVYPGRGETFMELYDLENDAGETINVADRFPKVGANLFEIVNRWKMISAPAKRELDLDAQTLQKLRSLGYLGDAE